MKPLPFSELVALVGDDNIEVQPLAECLTAATDSRHGYTKVTFGTQSFSAANALNNNGPVGIIVWLPRAKVDAIVAEREALATKEGASDV